MLAEDGEQLALLFLVRVVRHGLLEHRELGVELGLVGLGVERGDRDVATWYDENEATVLEKIEHIKAQAVSAKMAGLLSSDKDAAVKGLRDILHNLPVNEREDILKFLK